MISTKETFLHFDGKPDIWVRTGDELVINELYEVFVVDRIKVRRLWLGGTVYWS